MMKSISAFGSALCRYGFTAAAVTDIKEYVFDTMGDISLRTERGFKTMLKMLQKRTAITTQDGTVNNVVTNAPVIVSARARQCFYALLMCINIMSAEYRSTTPVGFTAAVLTEY